MSIVWSANQRGWIAPARRVFDEPGSVARQSNFSQRCDEYYLLWSYYNGSMFERFIGLLNGYRGWQSYRAAYNLYRNIRLLYNPTKRLVDFYAAQIYPGVLSEDGSALPDGISLAIPFSKDTSPELKAAIAQLWDWSGWQANKAVFVRYGAALGSVLVEVVDEMESGKVCMEVVWPGFVSGLDLDQAGNVKYYALEYDAYDEEYGMYRYRKVVNRQSIRYYRNDQAWDYGNGAVVPNVYGFVPAIWVRHQHTGSMHGSPAISGSLGKIDELNNLASHVHDQIHKIIGSPMVLWSSGVMSNLFGNAKRGPTDDEAQPSADQESVLMLKGPQGGHAESLAGNLDLAGVDSHVDRLIREIEKDHPELTFYDQLRQHTGGIGEEITRVFGDVTGLVLDAQSAYDRASISLFRMATAIAGMRANNGDWGSLTPSQQKFLPFNLDSYARGNLNMAIAPRPLVVPTKKERADERQSFWQGVGVAVQQAGVPVEVVLRGEGWTEDQLKQLGADKVAAIQRDQMLAQEDTIPAVSQ